MTALPAATLRPITSRMDRRRARTRDAILSAAAALLAHRSADAVNVDEITERADVAKGTFYNYFEDKDALIREIDQSVRASLEEKIQATNAGIDNPPERIARALAAALSFAFAEPERSMALLRMNPPAMDPGMAVNAGVRADIRAGREAGHFSSDSEEAAIVFVLGVIQAGLTRAIALPDKENVRHLGASLTLSLLRGLGVTNSMAERAVNSALKVYG